MPAEPTQAKVKRRSSRKDFDEYRFDSSHARELEQKRARGEVSCAECRRLKIKCDKQIPCQSCQRRGCAALCPNGSLSTGQGTRFVLAATEHLHRRIARLSNRIRQLEDALAALQAQHSSEPHPLLHHDLVTGEDDDALVSMNVAEDGNVGAGEKAQGHGHGEVIEALGTLSISDHGISRFFGPTGGSESLLLANLNPSSSSTTAGAPNPSPSTPTSSTSTTLSLRGSHSPHSISSAISTSTSAVSSTSDLALFSSSFPFTPLGAAPDVQALIESHLPPYDTAHALVHTYLAQCSWIFHGVTRAQLVDDMLPAIYRRPSAHTHTHSHTDTQTERSGGGHGVPPGEDYSGPHDLALLFIIFAIGALVRPEASPTSSTAAASISTSNTHPPTCHPHPSSNPHPHPNPNPSPPPEPTNTALALGEHYHQISRAALALQPVLEKPSIVTIQTLHLMSIYNAMSGSGSESDLRSGSETSMEMTWSLVTLAAHLSQTIGLHRDSARWGLSPKMVQRRRILFWDLFVADVWQSLNTGRPPSFSLAYIDCSFPDHGSGECEGFDTDFSIWQFRFAAECVADVTARTLTAEAPSYATIMELDRKVREFPLPDGMGSGEGQCGMTNGGAGSAGQGKEKEGDLAGSFQRCVLDHIRETVLMYIHRSFFAQAIIEHPANPLKSAYAPSFLAAYRASSTILKSVREQFGVWPTSCARFWTMWTFAFSAAVVFGTVVTRGPRSPLAQSAMAELEQACILFTKASVYSIRCTKALAILTKLAEKARHALAGIQKDLSQFSDGGGLHWGVKIKQEETEEDDELAIFAGHTRFVSAKKPAMAEVPLPVYPAPAPPPMAQQHHPLHQQEYQPQAHSRASAAPVPSMAGGWSAAEDGYMAVSRPEDHGQPPSPPTSHYPYVPSERTHQLESYNGAGGGSASGWEDERRSCPQQSYPPAMPMHLPRTVPSQYPTQYLHPPPQPPVPYQQHQPAYRAPPPPEQYQQYQAYPAHPPPQNQHEWHTRQQRLYPHAHPPPPPVQHQHQQPAFHTQAQHLPNTELADLGLASRDSRLDERWSLFMQDSGLLEGLDFRGR